MFCIRSVQKDDIENLYELSGFDNFINLPHNKTAIKKLVEKSLKSFRNPSKDLSENIYLFALEDLDKKKVIGTSLIHAQHGTEDEPHFFLSVGVEKKYSTTVKKGFKHGTLNLGIETDGPTEIGGLVLNPSYRGHPLKLGKQLSFARFLFMAIYPHLFKEQIHSELLPPFDENGNSPLWEALGRKFFHMDYHSADKMSRKNKEFILNLFPAENIYQTLLPRDAQDSIGKVGVTTQPVKRMLESVGFKYINEIDPFDGGPHYRCKLSQILPIKQKIICEIKYKESLSEPKAYLIHLNRAENFKAAMIWGERRGKKLYINQNHTEVEGTTTAIPLFY